MQPETSAVKSANLPTVNPGLRQRDIAKLFNVSERNLRYAKWILQNAPAEIIEQIEAGTLTIHKALNLCGYQRTQSKRNIEFKQSVLDLCTAVLDSDPKAKRLAADLLLKMVESKDVRVIEEDHT